MPLQDHFSGCAGQYAAFRPRYPLGLFRWLAAAAPGRKRAWDCACGSGQASVDLAEHFDEVIGTDLSSSQLAQARSHPRVAYRVGTAESSGLPDAAFDLVTVAQALHWFDLDRFYSEARRVLRPGGLLAAWCYGVCEIAAEHGQEQLQRFYQETIGPYWPPERRLVENGYRDLPFPATELNTPRIAMSLDWTLDELVGYVGSWSATDRYRQLRGTDPVAALKASLAPLWGAPTDRHAVRWPLSIRAARLGAPTADLSLP